MMNVIGMKPQTMFRGLAAIWLAWVGALNASAGEQSGDEAWSEDGWRYAQPGWRFEFPRDHHAHPEFKTEWWYVTGHLRDETGRELGYQVTFFRQGMQPPGVRAATGSRWLSGDVHLAHSAFSDKGRGRFEFDHRLSRGAFGEAGNAPAPGAGRAEDEDDDRVAWIDDWEMRWRGDRFTTVFFVGDTRFELELQPEKPPVFHGRDGYSPKGPGEGAGSHYYTFTRLRTSGTMTGANGRMLKVEGLSWMDREWSTSVLSDGQVGWDWFSLQLDDGSDLMAFQLRREDGAVDGHNHGTWVDAEGNARHLKADEFSLEPLRSWSSPDTGAEYPVAWRIRVPSLEVDLGVEAVFDRQELVLTPVTYWEGAIRVRGSHEGRGFLEMTGYSGPVEGLR